MKKVARRLQTPIILDHLQTCAACRRELEELKQTRKYLQAWKDEPPLRSVKIPGHEAYLNRRSGWVYLRYAAIAAMALICILALANTELTWNKSGFSISTHIFREIRQSGIATRKLKFATS